MEAAVFMSYSSKEYEIAEQIRSRIAAEGITTWMAPGSIEGGRSYAEQIPRAIRNCQVFVLVFSQNAMSSIWVSREVDRALNEGKRILPFVIEDAPLSDEFNFYLTNVQRYPAYLNFERELQRMIRDIHLAIGQPAAQVGEAKGAPLAGAGGAQHPTANAAPRPAAPAFQTAPAPSRAKQKAILPLILAPAAVLLGLLILWLVKGGKAKPSTQTAEQPTEAPAATEVAEQPTTAPVATKVAEQPTAAPAAETPAPEQPTQPPAASEPTDAPTSESEVTPAPAAPSETQDAQGVWRQLPIQIQGDDVQILSARYMGGPEIEKIEFYTWGGINGGCEFDIYLIDNRQIATIVAGVYTTTPISEEDYELYWPFAKKTLKSLTIPSAPQNPIAMNYGPIRASDFVERNSDYVIWYGVDSQGQMVSVIIVEIGIPLQDASASAADNWSGNADLPKLNEPIQVMGTLMWQSDAQTAKYLQLKKDYAGYEIADSLVLVLDSPFNFISQSGQAATIEAMIIPTNDVNEYLWTTLQGQKTVNDYLFSHVSIQGRLSFLSGEQFETEVYGPYKPEGYTGPGVIIWNPYEPYMLSAFSEFTEAE